MDIDLKQFQQAFFEESLELLDGVEQTLLKFDDSSELDMESINQLFRGMHSIKGGSATFGFSGIAEFTHTAETYLDLVRNNERTLVKESVNTLLQSVDWLRQTIATLQAEAEPDYSSCLPVKEEYNVFINQGEPKKEVSIPLKKEAPATQESDEIDLDSLFDSMVDERDGQVNSFKNNFDIFFKPHQKIFYSGNDPGRILKELETLGEMSIDLLESSIPDFKNYEIDSCNLAWKILLKTNFEKDDILKKAFDWVLDECDLTIENISCKKETPPPEPQVEAKTPAPKKSEPKKNSPTPKDPSAGSKEANSIRVSTEKLDVLINMVGELIITQSMLGRFENTIDSKSTLNLKEGLTRLDQNCRELQECVMRLRMLPVSTVFNRFPRMIRELSAKIDKKIQLKIIGENTEMDKTMLEKLSDPLVHLVRNSVDHGLEAEHIRKQNGKNPQGTVTLSAYHEGGSIIVEITDDGAGLNKKNITKKAVEKGLISENEVLTDEQIYKLIFQPGFSTAAQVTEVSGRGVGMDVVRKNIESLNGSIEIKSEMGVGTTIRVQLPLTLAILDGQLITVGHEKFIMPLISLKEIISIKSQNIYSVTESNQMYHLREHYIPIIRLYELFGITPKKTELENSFLNIVEVGGKLYGLVADDLLTQQQVVIKSLDHNYRRVDGVSGATILGDGTVALILDVSSLVRNAVLKVAATITSSFH